MTNVELLGRVRAGLDLRGEWVPVELPRVLPNGRVEAYAGRLIGGRVIRDVAHQCDVDEVSPDTMSGVWLAALGLAFPAHADAGWVEFIDAKPTIEASRGLPIPQQPPTLPPHMPPPAMPPIGNPLPGSQPTQPPKPPVIQAEEKREMHPEVKERLLAAYNLVLSKVSRNERRAKEVVHTHLVATYGFEKDDRWKLTTAQAAEIRAWSEAMVAEEAPISEFDPNSRRAPVAGATKVPERAKVTESKLDADIEAKISDMIFALPSDGDEATMAELIRMEYMRQGPDGLEVNKTATPDLQQQVVAYLDGVLQHHMLQNSAVN
jgi:hypothetical protein